MVARAWLGSWLVAFILPGAASAAVFALPHLGAEAMGTAGAFAGQASGPSAIRHNPGGLAFMEEGKVLAGLSVVALADGQYQGRAPGIGAGDTGDQETWREIPLYLYTVKPLGPRWRLGVGIDSPFLLRTEWTEPDAFPGRASVQNAELRTFDLTGVLAWKAGSSLGFAVGAVYRSSDFSLLRREQRTNPLVTADVDVASVAIEGDLESAVGWTVGMAYKPSDRFSWGFSFRSEIEIDYAGAGTLTQILTGDELFDDLITATVPFGEPLAVSSRVTFPAEASIGLRLGSRRALLIDVEWAAWGEFRGLPITFVNDPVFSTSPAAGNYDDVVAGQVGFVYTRRSGAQLRAGAAFDPSPQPDNAVGALLADSDRTTVSLGYGRDWLNLALAFEQGSRRTVLTSSEGLNGAYETSAWVLGISISP